MNLNKQKILFITAGIVVFLIVLVVVVSNRDTPNIQEGPSTQEVTYNTSLSVEGVHTKQELVDSFGAESGVIFTSNDFQVEYVSQQTRVDGYFLVKITTENTEGVEKTKNKAKEWFLEKGFIQEDLCAVDIRFYPSHELRYNYREEKKQFNPYIEGC